ncbi:hypothetical protein [Solibacillus sp. CAU 1738]|uniref:hypothetical protein n=1 Tax=Solibacillus sp. CAU 1738 TaxID=3140363 RepID=UPI003260DC70
MLKKEIIEQIELIERDHKIKPDPKRRGKITLLMQKIHKLYSRIQNNTHAETINAFQGNLYTSINLLINTMEHPEEIINALSKKRFFTIRQYPLLLLDSVTGILFPKNTKDFLYSSLSLAERNRVLKDFKLEDLSSWQFPRRSDLDQLFNTQIARFGAIKFDPDKTTLFDFTKIWIEDTDVDAIFDTNSLNKYSSDLTATIAISLRLLNNSLKNNADSALFLPISKQFKPDGYFIDGISEHKQRLALFIYNANLNIDFSVQAHNQLYELFYVNYLNLHLQLADEVEVSLPSKSAHHTVTLFDATQFKRKSVTSLVSYCPAALEFLHAAENYIVETEKTLQQLHENIAAASKELLEQQKHPFLQSSLDVLINTLSIQGDHPLQFISDSKQNVVALHQQLKNAKTYTDLIILEKQQKVSYSLLVEFSEKLIHTYFEQITYLGANTEVIQQLTDWYKNSIQAIQQQPLDEIKSAWQAEAIDAEEYEQWLTEMDAILLSKYELFIPILNDLLANNISFATFEQFNTNIQSYIYDIYQLFKKQRVEAHQKFAFQLGGDLQEKLEVQTLLYKLVSPLITSIHDYMKGCSTEEQQSIAAYLQLIIEVPINQLDNLVADFTFVQDILEDFHLLKQSQLANFTADTEHFIEQQQQRDARYNALMYKMRKQLMKQ